jgi:uncharacterized protein YpmB
MRVTLALILVFILCSAFACSKASPEAAEVKAQTAAIIAEYAVLVEAPDDYDTFVAGKEKWENQASSLSNADAAVLAKKLAVYYDMRIGVINGASQMAANKLQKEFAAMVKELEKKHGVKLH